MIARPREVPGETEWAGREQDLDVQYAYHRYFGKTTDDVKYDFRDLVIERASELRFVPRSVFQYYVFAWIDLFESPGESVGQSDCASVFLNLLRDREEADPGSVAEIYAELRVTVEYVAANQEFFDADVDIYGDFRDRAADIKALCELPDTDGQA